MEASILTSTKKVLGIAASDTSFDEDVLMHLNAAFSTLHDLGLGQIEGFVIEDAGTEWEEFEVPTTQIGAVRTYVFLRVRMLFDPPTLSFMIDAAEKQIKEYEWRLNTMREYALPEEEVVVSE